MGLPNVEGIVQGYNLRMEVVSVLSQFIARTMPESRLWGVGYDPDQGPGGVVTLFVRLDDLKFPLFLGRAPTMLMPDHPMRVETDPVTSDDM